MTNTTATKCCSKCKQVYPATLEFFQSNKGRKDGLHSWCKQCKQTDQKAHSKQYYIEHREECLQRAKNIYHANPEKQHERSRKWHREHRELANARSAESNKKLRKQVLNHYGGKCECCGEEIYEFLSIYHINGGGRKHRLSIPHGHLSRWLRDNNYPNGFRVLCHYCNQALGHYGYCPHQTK